MKWVDKDPLLVKSDLVDHGYCMSKPALFLTSQLSEHHKSYMANWLAAHHAWISQLDHTPLSQFLFLQLWQDFLNSSPFFVMQAQVLSTLTSQGKKILADTCRTTIHKIFQDAMVMKQGLTWAPKENVE